MQRTIFLLYSFIKFAFSKDLLFRSDLVGRMTMDLIYYVVSVLYYKILFLHTSTLGGWSESQALILVGAFTVMDALHMAFFSNGTWQLIGDINSGAFDYALTRPISPILFTFRGFSVASFVDLLFALGFLIWAICQSTVSFSFDELLIFSILLMNGVFIFYLLRILSITPSFWSQGRLGLSESIFQIYPLIETPDPVYSTWTRRVLLTILPLSMIASFPVRILYEGLTWKALCHVIGVSIGLLLFVNFIWRKGLKAYSSASS